MLKGSSAKLVSMGEWDDLVEQTYGRPYCFQQQGGCKDRGVERVTVPGRACDFANDTIPEQINGPKMGVSFKAWLARDPNEWNGKLSDLNYVYMFWQRNFYPDVQMVANDLHAKGLIEAGEYAIEIDW